jgi:hypothetical protein
MKELNPPLFLPNKDDKGIIIPEDRLTVYKRLLVMLENEKEQQSGNAFMCNRIYFDSSCRLSVNLNTDEIGQSELPELRKQRPRDLAAHKHAWYSGYEVDKRIAAVNAAIKLWNKKYAK